MKNTFYLIKTITIALCIALSLSACAYISYENSSIPSAESNFSSEESSSLIESISSAETSSKPTNSETSSQALSSNETSSQAQSSTESENKLKDIPVIDENTKYGDLLSQIPSGKKVTLLGELADEKYKDAAARLEKVLKGYSREISLVAYSLDNTKAVSFNAEAELFPACTVKAAYSLYNCLEMDKGNGSLNTEMKYEKKHYEPGTGDMQYKPVGTVFDMKTIIHKSMSISDNVGYMMQVDYFGRDGYNKWISDLGCPSLQIKPTVWALRAKADEHAVMWREIYRYFVSGGKHSEFLFSTCTGTADNFASKALQNVSYSHKQGFNRDTKWNSMSDAGIVWKDGNPYIIVMLTNSEGITTAAQNVMNEAIKIIHNEMF